MRVAFFKDGQRGVPQNMHFDKTTFESIGPETHDLRRGRMYEHINGSKTKTKKEKKRTMINKQTSSKMLDGSMTEEK